MEMSTVEHIKHFLAFLLSLIYNHLQYSDQSRKNKCGFWNDIRNQAIYFQRRSNPYRPLEWINSGRESIVFDLAGVAVRRKYKKKAVEKG